MRKKILIAIVLFLIPIVGRLGWHYRGLYTPPPVPTGEMAVPVPPTPPLKHVEDRPTPGKGTVVFDVAHDNRYTPEEVNVLVTRLANRGFKVEFLNKDENGGNTPDLAARLRYASALVVLSPATSFGDDEVMSVDRFVEKGGRLLLAADPTRFDYRYDDTGMIVGIKSLVPAINSLATSFDIVFDDNYLYNLQENEANYRNIILREFASDPLTKDVKEAVFYATHSLRTQGKRLAVADENSFSSLNDGKSGLPVMARAGQDNVVAVGDLTFLIEPYNAVMDNDRLVSNLADFLTGGKRQYKLADFPYFFSGPVDVIQAQEVFLDGQVIAQGGALQESFQKAGMELRLRDKEDKADDTIFLGSFDGADRVKDYLAEEGIEFIFVEEEPTPKPGETITPTPTATATPAAKGKKKPEVDRIAIDGVGEIGMSGTTLFLLTGGESRHVLIALAEDGDALASALTLLVSGDLSNCFSGREVTVCSNGGMSPGGEMMPGLVPTPSAETPTPEEETPTPEK